MKKERKFGLKEFPRPLLMENGGTTEFILSIIPEWTYDEVEKMRREWELGKLI